MSVTDRIRRALTSMIELGDKVTRHAEALTSHQSKIEDPTALVVWFEAQLGSLTSAAVVKRPKGA